VVDYYVDGGAVLVTTYELANVALALETNPKVFGRSDSRLLRMRRPTSQMDLPSIARHERYEEQSKPHQTKNHSQEQDTRPTAEARHTH